MVKYKYTNFVKMIISNKTIALAKTVCLDELDIFFSLSILNSMFSVKHVFKQGVFWYLNF